MDNNDNLKHEYKDLSDNMRFYANYRFVILTIFVGLMGGLIFLLYNKETQLNCFLRKILKGYGILIAIILFIMERRAVDYYWKLRERAIELEKKLNYSQYKNLEEVKRESLSATNVTMVIYICAIIFWVITLYMK